MHKLINIGFGNYVNTEKIVAIAKPDAAPIKRMIISARKQEAVIDATQGRRTKSVIITGDHTLILSALQSDTICRRFNSNITEEREDNDHE